MPDCAHYIPDKNYPKLLKTIQTRQTIIGKEIKDLHLNAQRRIRGLKSMKGKVLLSRQGYAAQSVPLRHDMIIAYKIMSVTVKMNSYEMNITLDHSQGDNTNVFQNSNIYRGEENIPEGAVDLTPGCQGALSR